MRSYNQLLRRQRQEDSKFKAHRDHIQKEESLTHTRGLLAPALELVALQIQTAARTEDPEPDSNTNTSIT